MWASTKAGSVGGWSENTIRKGLKENGRGKLEILSRDNFFKDRLCEKTQRNGIGRKKNILIQDFFFF